jgi:hypothetical protein
VRAWRRSYAGTGEGAAGTLTQPSPGGRGLCRDSSFVPLLLPPRRLDGLAPPIEHARDLHRLVRRNLAGRHCPDRRIKRRHDVARPHPLGQVDRDRPAALPRLQPVEAEPGRHHIAGERFVDYHPRHRGSLLGSERGA